MLKTLVLDPTYQPVRLFPLRSITWEAAICRVLNETCSVVSEYEEEILTKNFHLNKPAVIVRKEFVKRSNLVMPTREAIYYRDGCSCQYCGKPLSLKTMTLDHVIPTSNGGERSFDNLVASCEMCNGIKGSKKWKPKRWPWTPSYRDMIALRRKYPLVIPTEKWVPFLEPWEGGIEISEHLGGCGETVNATDSNPVN